MRNLWCVKCLWRRGFFRVTHQHLKLNEYRVRFVTVLGKESGPLFENRMLYQYGTSDLTLPWLPAHRKMGDDAVLNARVQQWLSFVLVTGYCVAELAVAASQY